MDDKKKKAGWLVLTVILILAGVALAVTNLVTEGPINRRSLGQAQAALEEMFPEADAGDAGFEPMTAEGGGLDFAYTVRQNGQTIGYAVQNTVQGYGGPIELVIGVNGGMELRGLRVGGTEFKETEGLGAKAKDASFTGQFRGKTPPLSLNGDIDGISGATVTSRAVVDGVNDGVSKLRSLLGDGAAAPPANSPGPDQAGVGQAAAVSYVSASTIGYGGPVLVELGLDANGAIASVVVGRVRFAETEGVGGKVREQAFTAQFTGKTPPLRPEDIDGVSGATISTRAVVDAVNEAAALAGQR